MTDKDKECRSQREAFEIWAKNNIPATYQAAEYGESLGMRDVNFARKGFQAGAAWRQSRLLDEELVERVAKAIYETGVFSVNPYTHAQAAIAEIKKHMEGVC